MNFSLDFIQFELVPLHSAQEKSHVIYYPAIHPFTLDSYLGFHSFSHLSNNKLAAN